MKDIVLEIIKFFIFAFLIWQVIELKTRVSWLEAQQDNEIETLMTVK